ncbi:MAG: hypothetical protein Q9182_007538, partial [Xanthomendoza sp. 2 TL-2023]
IDRCLDMLAWNNDPYLKYYQVQINSKRIQTNARVLPSPALKVRGPDVKPGSSGKWNLKDRRFIAGNYVPLVSWGVMTIKPGASAENIALPQVKAFITTFVKLYEGYGGNITSSQPCFREMNHDADLAGAVKDLHESVSKRFNRSP